jgi:hypothetical protein
VHLRAIALTMAISVLPLGFNGEAEAQGVSVKQSVCARIDRLPVPAVGNRSSRQVSRLLNISFSKAFIRDLERSGDSVLVQQGRALNSARKMPSTSQTTLRNALVKAKSECNRLSL